MDRNYFGLAIIVAVAQITAAAELPDATLIDPDLIWDKSQALIAQVSPDGKSIAYISKGGIWMSGIAGGPPAKLADLPNTMTEFLARPEFGDARGDQRKIFLSLGNQAFNSILRSLTSVDSFQWTRSQDGVVYVLPQYALSNVQAAVYRVMHASIDGSATTLVTIERGAREEPHALSDFHVRNDNKFVVATGRCPLFWDVVANKPRATCFDYLLPSPTSDRYLGIEIDTRQLVVVDENFKIIKRIDVTFDVDRQCDLIWSPDERFAICRSFRSGQEPISNNCTEFRVNLETGERRTAKHGIEGDRYFFSGRGGEVARIGIEGLPPEGYGDGSYGSFIELIPDGDGDAHEIYRFANPDRMNEWHTERYPPVLCNSDCTLFAMALPRPKGDTPGFHYHLIDRSGRTRPFPPGDASQFITPYALVAFANDGQTILAHDGKQLFSIPVAVIEKVAGIAK